MNVTKMFFMNWAGSLEKTRQTFSGELQEGPYGVSIYNKHNTRISMIPWSRIVEVWY